ncbi:MAG: hypothetical protein ABGW67_06360 [Flavobacteriaceae bacterium]|jgi:hypothetical protein|nr:hypothetical protein [Flavobacteriaceae bacterium]
MKKIFLTILAFSSFTLFSQKKYIESMSFEQSQDISFFINVKNNTKLGEYITASGNSVKLGDTLIIGNPTSSYATSNTYGGGNKITFGRTKTRFSKEFEFIKLGRPAGIGAAMSGADTPMAGINLSKEVVLVKEMKTYHKGSKKKPLNVQIILGEINGRAFGINKYLSVMNTELAIESREIFLKNRKITREEAIVKLKEAKELLDLEMMSQEEYDAIKKELSPIIMNKK